jgi:hypothetical protein
MSNAGSFPVGNEEEMVLLIGLVHLLLFLPHNCLLQPVLQPPPLQFSHKENYRAWVCVFPLARTTEQST